MVSNLLDFICMWVIICHMFFTLSTVHVLLMHNAHYNQFSIGTCCWCLGLQQLCVSLSFYYLGSVFFRFSWNILYSSKIYSSVSLKSDPCRNFYVFVGWPYTHTFLMWCHTKIFIVARGFSFGCFSMSYRTVSCLILKINLIIVSKYCRFYILALGKLTSKNLIVLVLILYFNPEPFKYVLCVVRV